MNRHNTPDHHNLVTPALLITALLLAAPAHAQRLGEIRGVALDRATQQPLPGATVAVLDTDRGTVADAEGRFALPRMPAGVHRLRVTMIGYAPVVRTDVVVRPRRVTDIEIELDEVVVDLGEETVVVADYFSDAAAEAVGGVSFSYEEVRRSPGAAGDISRLLQAMPAVNMNTDERNDLIVRGGSPTENLVLVDHVEIPNINHFPTQGASGGPIGLLNTDLIEDVAFYAGGFSAAHGNRLSSVTVVDLREGSRQKLEGELQLGMAGAGLLLEGPLPGGGGSWIASGRRSYLDLIVDAIGTGAVPRYSDPQGKLSWDPSPRHRFSLLGIAGFDAIDFAPGDTDADEDFVVNGTDQYVAGAGWRWLWSRRGFARTSLAFTYADFGTDVLDGRTRDLLFANSSQERRIALRSDVTWSPAAGGELRVTLEGYLKRYRDLPFDPDDPTALVFDAFADFGTPAPGRLAGGGEAGSRGLEWMVQKKLARRLYGTASYAWARSRYTDLTGRERDRSFDNRHLVSLIVGYREARPGRINQWSRQWSPVEPDPGGRLRARVLTAASRAGLDMRRRNRCVGWPETAEGCPVRAPARPPHLRLQ